MPLKKEVTTTLSQGQACPKPVVIKCSKSMLFMHVPLKEKLFFVRNLGIMIRGGIPLSQAFKTLAIQTKNKGFATVLKEVSENIERGASITDSMRPYPKVFNDFFLSMMESGEISGKLEEVLAQLYIHIKKQHELISKVKSALTYPVVILIAMIGIGVFMMVSVVPKIMTIFEDYDAELPIITKMLINISNFVVNNGLFTGIAAITIILILVKILQTEAGKFAFQGITMRIPILSNIIREINLARFARTVSSLLKTDIMIIKTFQITANMLDNVHYKKVILEISEKIKKGMQINEVAANYPDFFPPMVVQMISVGEQTGELDNILAELAEFYEDEVDKTMENLPSLIEPLLILSLGAGVGLMAAAIILPMYSLTSSY